MELRRSEAVFVENPHGYHLPDGTRLSGITSLIHDVLGLGVYADASDFVLNVAIPMAAAYGTSIHKAIEFYDSTGIKNVVYNDERFGEFNVEEELEGYIANKGAHTTVANEFLVSYGSYASSIDVIWSADGEDIWLVDHKSNNVDYFPGGRDGLKEYLSWQLSCYAFMFEHQTGKKVAGLKANWLRHSEHELWDIERRPDGEVELLLSVPALENATGGFTYLPTDEVKALARKAPVKVQHTDILPQEAVMEFAEVLRTAERYKALLDEQKGRLKALMEAHGVKSWDAGEFKASITDASVSKTFDSTRFKKDHPEFYGQYLKESKRSSSITIKLN